MGCGCNKGKKSSVPPKAAKAPAPTTKKISTPPAQPSRTAATTARTTSYVLQMTSGHIQKYRTQLEAEAARVRFGGDGTIRER